MQKHFLCPNHRQWLTDHPDAANRHLGTCLESGQYYLDLGHPAEAIPYLGCAFETAEILLCTNPDGGCEGIMSFTGCAIALSHGLCRHGETGYAMEICQHSRQRLYREYNLHPRNADELRNIGDCMMALSNTEKSLQTTPLSQLSWTQMH